MLFFYAINHAKFLILWIRFHEAGRVISEGQEALSPNSGGPSPLLFALCGDRAKHRLGGERASGEDPVLHPSRNDSAFGSYFTPSESRLPGQRHGGLEGSRRSGPSGQPGYGIFPGGQPLLSSSRPPRLAVQSVHHGPWSKRKRLPPDSPANLQEYGNKGLPAPLFKKGA